MDNPTSPSTSTSWRQITITSTPQPHALYYVCPSQVHDDVVRDECANDRVKEAISGTDVLPGVYEGVWGGEFHNICSYTGGFKLWECATDLCKYMLTLGKERIGGRKVLEVCAFMLFCQLC